MELLYMKISDLFLEPDFDFLRFPNHETGLGVRYPARVSSPPPCIIDMPCDMLLRSIK